MTTEKTFTAWVMTGQGEPLEKRELPLDKPGDGEAVVEVAGCGVCHTDISFLHMGVPTRMQPPLTLGHEISGTVREVGSGVDASLVGRPVLIPAVLPCGECDLCRAGHRRICRSQVMPGNDRHGGFASHVTLPARYFAPIGDEVLEKSELWELSIVADAMTTPFQAIRKSGLEKGELAIIVGAGGIGIHAVQIAAALGARVLVLDIDAAKLEQASAHGAAAAIDVSGLDIKELKTQVKDAAKSLGAPKYLWKIFEMSGTKPGQETAFALMGFGSHLATVGFTMDKLELRLSNLMAFDATVAGNWGCDPELYPEILEWIARERVRVTPFVEKHPLAEINAVLDAAHAGKLLKRAVMCP